MSCIVPQTIKVINKYGTGRTYKIPCGHCLNCMVSKQSQLEFLCKKELLYKYRNNQGASFVTLTYDDNHIPVNENGFTTLRRSDVQKFIKNMRRQMEYHNCKIDFKYIYCGEYGDGSHSEVNKRGSINGISTCRPHYHIVFIGLSDDVIRKYTRKLWRHGLCDIGALSAGGLRYICKYMTKACPDKDVKQLREIAGVENPFIYHSIGMGKQWIIDNMDKIVENNFTFNVNGKIQLFPKYVMRFVSAHTGVNYLPKITEYLHKYKYGRAKATGLTYTQYDYENSLISYEYKVAALRSKGKPVTDQTLQAKFYRSEHYHDRPLPKNVSDFIKNHEFVKPTKSLNKIIPRLYNGGIDWDLYLYGDKIPF